MALYNCFLKEVTKDVLTNTGGTAIQILGRETVQPANPATGLNCTSAIAGGATATDVAKLTLPEGLVNELNAGAKVTAVTVWLNCKGAGAASRWKFGTLTPAVSGENVVEGTVQRWSSVSLSGKQAAEQTKATLEALEVFIEHLTVTSTACYEIYVAVELTTPALPEPVPPTFFSPARLFQPFAPQPSAAEARAKQTGEGAAVISGGAAVSDLALKIGTGAAVVSGGGLVTSIGLKVTSSPAVVRGGGRVAPVAAAVRTGSAALSGGGRATATGVAVRTGTAVVTGGGRIQSISQAIGLGSAVVRGGGRIALLSGKIVTGSAAVRGGGAATVRGGAQAAGLATLSGGGRTAPTGTRVRTGAATVSGGGKLVDLAVALARGVAALSSGGRISPTGKAVVSAVVVVKGGGRAVAAGGKQASGTASIRAGGRVGAGGTRVAIGIAAIRGGGRITSTGGEAVVHLRALEITFVQVSVPDKQPTVAEAIEPARAAADVPERGTHTVNEK